MGNLYILLMKIKNVFTTGQFAAIHLIPALRITSCCAGPLGAVRVELRPSWLKGRISCPKKYWDNAIDGEPLPWCNFRYLITFQAHFVKHFCNFRFWIQSWANHKQDMEVAPADAHDPMTEWLHIPLVPSGSFQLTVLVGGCSSHQRQRILGTQLQ